MSIHDNSIELWLEFTRLLPLIQVECSYDYSREQEIVVLMQGIPKDSSHRHHGINGLMPVLPN